MRCLIAAIGSHGDVLPFVALGRELRLRGHEVILYAAAPFAPLVQSAGLEFRAQGSELDYEQALRNPDLNNPLKVLPIMAEGLDRLAAPSFRQMEADLVAGRTIVIASILGFVARSLAERYDLPLAVLHLAPALLRSQYRSPRLGRWGLPEGAPRFLHRWQYFLADHLMIEPSLGAALNRHRVAVGLAPQERFLQSWLHRADLLVGLFPPWFAPLQPDWPAHLVLTDFPLFDDPGARGLPPELEAFLAEGPPPIGFTAGTATASESGFFAVSAEACRRINRRGLLLTRFPAQLPAILPAQVMTVDYAPYSLLLPRLTGLVHHGGIGTMSQALRAGIPQLIRPMAHDQFDNALHARRLGVARELAKGRYSVHRVIAALDGLTSDRQIGESCARIAAQMRGDGLAVTCDLIEKLSQKTH